MKPRFLIDESLPRWLVLGVRRVEPAIDIVRVGEPDALPFGTPDADILRFAERAGCLLITADLRTMPDHIADHVQAGGHHAGVCFVRLEMARRELIDDIVLLWHASEAEEWVGQISWLPL